MTFVWFTLPRKFGYFRIIKLSFLLKILVPILIYLGSSYWPLLVLFFLCNSILASSPFSYFNLVVSDLAEEDKMKNNRQNLLPAMYFGFNAFFTKPGQRWILSVVFLIVCSVAPVLVWHILSRYGYQQGETSNEVNPEVQDIHSVCCFGCRVCVALSRYVPLTFWVTYDQLILWSFYSLHGKYLSEVKSCCENEKADYSESQI